MTDRIIIVTTSEIINPEVDRRSKDWTKLPTVPAGTRFIVTETRDGYLQIQSARGGYAWTSNNSALGKLVMDNSCAVPPETVKEYAAVNDCEWGGDEILRILLKLGRVKPEDFAAVAAVPEGF